MAILVEQHLQIETPKIPFGISRDGAGAVTTRGAPAHPQLQWYRWRLITRRWARTSIYLGVLAAGRVVLRATLGTHTVLLRGTQRSRK